MNKVTYYAQQNAAGPGDTEQNTDCSMVLAPYVLPEMCTPEFWIDRQMEADKLLMNQTEITSLNNATKNILTTNMHLLSNLEETYDEKDYGVILL